jgi:hypothetical protein
MAVLILIALLQLAVLLLLLSVVSEGVSQLYNRSPRDAVENIEQQTIRAMFRAAGEPRLVEPFEGRRATDGRR